MYIHKSQWAAMNLSAGKTSNIFTLTVLWPFLKYFIYIFFQVFNHETPLDHLYSSYPKITAFQTIMLFSDGAPLTPAGGSSWSLWDKSHHKTIFQCVNLNWYLTEFYDCKFHKHPKNVQHTITYIFYLGRKLFPYNLNKTQWIRLTKTS